MVLNKKFELGCDTAHFAAVDLAFLEANGGHLRATAQYMCKILDLEPGRYNVRIKVLDCWDGIVTVEDELDIKSGKLMIGDCCYFWSANDLLPGEEDSWHNFLEVTNNLRYCDQMLIAKTGGDGAFEVEVTIKKVK